MKDHTAFHAAMAELLQVMGIAPPAGQESEAYELQFNDDSKIYFSCVEEGSIDAIAEAGTLRNPDEASVLLDLLALNQPVAGKPILTVSVDRADMRVLLRGRVPLAGITCDRLTGMTWAMSERLAGIRNCLGHTVRAREKRDAEPMQKGTLQRLGLRRP